MCEITVNQCPEQKRTCGRIPKTTSIGRSRRKVDLQDRSSAQDPPTPSVRPLEKAVLVAISEVLLGPGVEGSGVLTQSLDKISTCAWYFWNCSCIIFVSRLAESKDRALCFLDSCIGCCEGHDLKTEWKVVWFNDGRSCMSFSSIGCHVAGLHHPLDMIATPSRKTSPRSPLDLKIPALHAEPMEPMAFRPCDESVIAPQPRGRRLLCWRLCLHHADLMGVLERTGPVRSEFRREIQEDPNECCLFFGPKIFKTWSPGTPCSLTSLAGQIERSLPISDEAWSPGRWDARTG